MSALSGVQELSQETIELTRKVFANEIEKAITVSSTGLVGYNLEAPSKKLYPVVTPLRNRIPRVPAPGGATASNWKEITAVNSAKLMPFVSFGTRNASTISYTKNNRSATYKSYGMEDSVEDEAVWMGRKFEDVRAFSALATLQSLMIVEEAAILGGVSDTNTLGTPATPTVTKASGTTGAWGGATNYVQVKVAALPLFGYINSNLADLTAAIADHSLLSSKGSVQLGATTDVVTAVLTPKMGAVAYAWFVADKATNDAADSEMYLMAITTVPAAQFTVSTNTHYAANNITDDTSGNANAFDGIISQLVNPTYTLTTLDATSYSTGVLKYASGTGGNAIVFDMNVDATNYLGTKLSSDGAGGIVEFDAVLKALWDRSKVGPTVAMISSQEAISITKLIGGNSSGLGWRINAQDGASTLVGGIYIGGYLNKFVQGAAPGIPAVVPFMIHPNAVPGHVVFLTERLPFPDNNVPNVWEMELIQEYADFEWARTQRKYEHGVYANGVLKSYFGAGQAVIRHIRPS